MRVITTGFDLDVLADGIEPGRLEELDVRAHRGIGGRGEESVRPPALVEGAPMEVSLSIEREAQVAEEQEKNAALTAELARLRGEHSSVKNQIIQRRAALASSGVRLSPASEREVQTALAANPQKVESLRKAIADARDLSAKLARLSG